MFAPICVHQLIVYQVPREFQDPLGERQPEHQHRSNSRPMDMWKIRAPGVLLREGYGEHIGLSHDMTEAWALAMVRELWITV